VSHTLADIQADGDKDGLGVRLVVLELEFHGIRRPIVAAVGGLDGHHVIATGAQRCDERLEGGAVAGLKVDGGPGGQFIGRVAKVDLGALAGLYALKRVGVEDVNFARHGSKDASESLLNGFPAPSLGNVINEEDGSIELPVCPGKRGAAH